MKGFNIILVHFCAVQAVFQPADPNRYIYFGIDRTQRICVDMMIWYKPKAISGMMTGRGLDKMRIR